MLIENNAERYAFHFFDKYTVSYTKDFYRILIIDWHDNHYLARFLAYRTAYITTVCLFSHRSYIQPIGVS